jgi:hypothetical protein
MALNAVIAFVVLIGLVLITRETRHVDLEGYTEDVEYQPAAARVPASGTLAGS